MLQRVPAQPITPHDFLTGTGRQTALVVWRIVSSTRYITGGLVTPHVLSCLGTVVRCFGGISAYEVFLTLADL